MKFAHVLGLAVAATVVLSAAGDAFAAKKPGKCVLAGGTGSGLTPEIAKMMAGDALKSSIGSKKASGKVKMTCKTELLTECKATQRAC